MQIGFIDYYLDEWHANNYPRLIQEVSKGEMTVAYAYGMVDAPSGITSRQWCESRGIALCETIEEVISKSDLLIVLSPDNPEMHWELCQLPLRSGKPTYVDKTFACSAKEATELFEIAKAHGTPMFSSSALRFSTELAQVKREDIQSVVSIGPGRMDTYLIHQVEPLVALFGTKATAICFTGSETTPMFSLAFGEGKRAAISILGFKSPCPFASFIQYGDGTAHIIENANSYFENFIVALVRFFESKQAPVDAWQTIEVMRIIEKALEAARIPDTWISLSE